MIIAVIAGFAVFIVPTYGDIGELRAKSADYETILANARTLQAERNKLVEKYNAFDATSLASVNTMLPTNPQNVKLILELDALASQYGMVLQNVKIEDPATNQSQTQANRAGQSGQNPDVGTLKIAFSATGPYNGLSNFLRSIEKSLRIIDVRKVAFSAVDDKQSYQYAVTINTYWLK